MVVSDVSWLYSSSSDGEDEEIGWADADDEDEAPSQAFVERANASNKQKTSQFPGEIHKCLGHKCGEV